MTSVLKPKAERDPTVIKVNKSGRKKERDPTCKSGQLFHVSAHRTQRVSFPIPSPFLYLIHHGYFKNSKETRGTYSSIRCNYGTLFLRV